MADPSWHDALELAVPEPDVPADLLSRLEHAVRVSRRRRRGAAAGSAVLVAAIVAAVLVAPGLGHKGTPAGAIPKATVTVGVALRVTAPCIASDDPMLSPPAYALPASFIPTQAFVCVDDSRRFPGDGEWSVLLGQRLTGDLTQLVRALRHPDELSRANPQPSSSPGGPVVACAASLVITPTLVLYDSADRAFPLAIPRVGSCNDPSEAVTNALRSLKRTTVQVLKLTQVQTQAQVEATRGADRVGCTGQFKDLFRLKAIASHRDRGTLISWPATTVSACFHVACFPL